MLITKIYKKIITNLFTKKKHKENKNKSSEHKMKIQNILKLQSLQLTKKKKNNTTLQKISYIRTFL